MKAKVLHVLEATQGGTRRHVVNLLLAADRSRFDVGLVYSLHRADGSFEADLQALGELGTRLIEVPMVREISAKADLPSLVRLARVVRRESPHILHLHAAKAGFLGRLAARAAWRRPAVVYSPHGGSFHDTFGTVRNRAFVGLERLALPLTDAVINVSECATHVFAVKARAPQSKLVTIHNGIIAPELVPPEGAEQLRRDLGIPRTAFVVTVVALMNANKGHEVLLDALELVHRDPTGRDIVCLMVGDGPLRRQLEQRVRACGLNEAVRFVGYRPDAHRYIAAGDTLVLPSVAEVFGLVLVEAMLLGRPVIASRVGGIPEVVDHDLTGLLVPPGDPRGLAAAILRLASCRELAARLGANAAVSARRFLMPRMVRETEAIYARLLDPVAHG